MGNSETRDEVGFLPYALPIEFVGGSIRPLSNFRESEETVRKVQNRDGFVYPPTEVSHRGTPIPGKPYRTEDDLEWRVIPNTRRPALLHKILPPSHELIIYHPPLGADFRTSDGGFLMHLAGYVFGVRLQFSDWWLDGRIPVRSTHNVHASRSRLGEFFTHSYREWRRLDAQSRLLMINILYMNARSPSYEWEWERFTVNYMVFDALYKFAGTVQKVRDKLKGRHRPHKTRLSAMCKRFKIRQRKVHQDLIWSLRNDLFHEALWDKGQPCSTSDAKAFMAADHLRRLNQRLVPAVLGFPTEYIRTAWWSLSRFSL